MYQHNASRFKLLSQYLVGNPWAVNVFCVHIFMSVVVLQRYGFLLDIQSFLWLYYGKWRFFITPVGGFSSRQLAVFHYASWR
ncbi:MAG: hypothetical protein SPK85_02200 [Prevotella sp.]|nr:hypothetical protein [Prevotella sp.]